MVSWKDVCQGAFITQLLYFTFQVTQAHSASQRKASRTFQRTAQRPSEMKGVQNIYRKTLEKSKDTVIPLVPSRGSFPPIAHRGRQACWMWMLAQRQTSCQRFPHFLLWLTSNLPTFSMLIILYDHRISFLMETSS